MNAKRNVKAEMLMCPDPVLPDMPLNPASEFERRVTEKTYAAWQDIEPRQRTQFMYYMLNDYWREDGCDFLLVYDRMSPEFSSIVVCGTGAQEFLGMPSSTVPAAQKLPSQMRERFLVCARRALELDDAARSEGTYVDKRGNHVLYRAIFMPTNAADERGPICMYGTFSARIVD